jgi:hypothetical protein
MAVNQEFLGRLEREIESLTARVEDRKANNNPEDAEFLRQTEAQLAGLKEMRRQMIAQSHGG